MLQSTQKFKFQNLDSIRSIAFLSTFLAHAFYTESQSVLSTGVYKSTLKFQEIFAFGVPVFFVLSGFLITYLMLKEQMNNHFFDIKKFYMRRILRIWPVYFIVLFVGFVLFPILRNNILHIPYEENANPYFYIFFLSNLDQLKHSTLPFGVGLGPTWSVAIEEQFYLFWPIFLLIFKKAKFIFPIVITLVFSVLISEMFNLSNKHTLFCMTYLSIGGLFGYLSFYKKTLVKKLINIHSIVFVMIVSILFIFMYLTTLGFNNLLLILLIALIIGYIIIFQCFSGKLELKKIPFIEKLGKYTYGLYLYHSICIFFSHIFIDDILHFEETIFSVIFLKPIVSFTLSLFLSYFSYHYIESFFLNLKLRFSV